MAYNIFFPIIILKRHHWPICRNQQNPLSSGDNVQPLQFSELQLFRQMHISSQTICLSISSNSDSYSIHAHTHTHTHQTYKTVTGMLCWPTTQTHAHTLLQHNCRGHLTFLFLSMNALCPIDLRVILIVSAVHRALKGKSGRTNRGQWPTLCCQLQRENPLMKNSFTSLPRTEKEIWEE